MTRVHGIALGVDAAILPMACFSLTLGKGWCWLQHLAAAGYRTLMHWNRAPGPGASRVEWIGAL